MRRMRPDQENNNSGVRIDKPTHSKMKGRVGSIWPSGHRLFRREKHNRKKSIALYVEPQG